MKRTAFMKLATGSAVAGSEPTKSSRQSIRGRISGPIPMPEPMAPNSFPIPVPSHLAPIPFSPPHPPHPPPQAQPLQRPEQQEEPYRESDESPGQAPPPPPENMNEPQHTEEPASQVIEPAPPPLASAEPIDVTAPDPEPITAAHTPESRLQFSPQPLPLRPRLTMPSGTGLVMSSMTPNINITSPSSSGSNPNPNDHTSHHALGFRHAADPSSTLRSSQGSGTPSTAATAATSATVATSAPTTASVSPKPQRRKPTLRDTLHKLFGRRKKPDSRLEYPVAATERATSTPRKPAQAKEQVLETGPQHRSVLSDPSVGGQRDGTPGKRSISMPITEFDRALRSHSVGPEQIAAIEGGRLSFPSGGNADNASASASTNIAANTSRAVSTHTAGGRHRPTASSNSHLTYHRNALYGRLRHDSVFSGGSPDMLSGAEWTGLSPRPASAHDRGSNNRTSSNMGLAAGSSRTNASNLAGSSDGDGGLVLHTHTNDASEIGRAITSDHFLPGDDKVDRMQRRRSRSMSGMHDLVLNTSLDERRRSDEIRYWRESYDPAFLSPLSSGRDIGDDADGGDGQDRHVDEFGNTQAAFGSVALDGDSDEDKDEDDDDDEDGKEFQDMDDTNMGAASLLQSFPDSPVTSQGPRNDLDPRSRTPPQPFTFGSLARLGTPAVVATSPAGVGSDADMAAASDTEGNTTARLGGLETRMSRVERVVGQLCHAVPGFEAPLEAKQLVPRSMPSLPTMALGGSEREPAMPPIPAMYQTQAATTATTTTTTSQHPFPRHSHSGYYSQISEQSAQSFESGIQLSSRLSFGEGQTYIGSLYPPSSEATQAQSVAATAGGETSTILHVNGDKSNNTTLSPGGRTLTDAHTQRPESLATIRGATSLPSLGSGATTMATGGAVAIDFAAQLATERAVRHDLEAQVRKLNERVNALSTTMYAMLREPSTSGSVGSGTATTPEGAIQTATASAATASASTTTGGRALSPGKASSSNLREGRTGPTRSVKTLAAEAAALTGVNVLPQGEDDGEGKATADSQVDELDWVTTYPETSFPARAWQGSKGRSKNGGGDDKSRRRKAARTLSLGQLTLGKSAVQA